MAFIPEVSEEQASAELRALYDTIKKNFGFLPRFWQAQGSRPEVVRASLDLYHTIYDLGVLPRTLKEEIGLVVSALNSNSYCIAAHLEILKSLGVDKALGRQLIRNYERADVPEKEKALFRFADKLTREPFKIKQEDIDALRQQGWDDAAILEASLAASHFSFLNRLSTALGVIPEHVF